MANHREAQLKLETQSRYLTNTTITSTEVMQKVALKLLSLYEFDLADELGVAWLEQIAATKGYMEALVEWSNSHRQ